MALLSSNNLVHGEILLEGGEAQLRNNLTGRLLGCFVDPPSGNLALTSAATKAIGKALPLAEVVDDIRQQARGEHPNLGAWKFPRQ